MNDNAEKGEKALRFLRELRQYLDRRLRRYGDDGDLSDYEVGCKQELEGVSTWLAEFEAQSALSPAIDDLRNRVDALEAEVRAARANAGGMSGYFSLGGRLNSMQERIYALESAAPMPVEDGER